MFKRHTVSIRHEVYAQLQNHGKFGESFSDLLSRILDFYENNLTHAHPGIENQEGSSKT
jgi:predicted CopG family antitoxin